LTDDGIICQRVVFVIIVQNSMDKKRQPWEEKKTDTRRRDREVIIINETSGRVRMTKNNTTNTHVEAYCNDVLIPLVYGFHEIPLLNWVPSIWKMWKDRRQKDAISKHPPPKFWCSALIPAIRQALAENIILCLHEEQTNFRSNWLKSILGQHVLIRNS